MCDGTVGESHAEYQTEIPLEHANHGGCGEPIGARDHTMRQVAAGVVEVLSSAMSAAAVAGECTDATIARRNRIDGWWRIASRFLASETSCC